MDNEQLPLKEKRSSLPFNTRRLIANHVESVCRKNTAGNAVYDEGHSDEVIAALFQCTVHNVASIRKEIIGNLGDDDARLAALEKRVAALEAYINPLKRIGNQ